MPYEGASLDGPEKAIDDVADATIHVPSGANDGDPYLDRPRARLHQRPQASCPSCWPTLRIWAPNGTVSTFEPTSSVYLKTFIFMSLSNSQDQASGSAALHPSDVFKTRFWDQIPAPRGE